MNETTLSLEVISKYKNDIFIETGTSQGAGVALALKAGFSKIYSIELDSSLQGKNISYFSKEISENIVELIIGDSLNELINLIPKIDKRITFWLDAHVDGGPSGIKKCPLYEELISINDSPIKNHTILIDDMRMLGHHWGEGIYITEIKNKILEINPKYKFKFENGFEKDDILVAYI